MNFPDGFFRFGDNATFGSGTIVNNGFMSIEGRPNFGGTIDNAGTIKHSANLDFFGGAQINNLAGGVYEVQSGSSGGIFNGAATGFFNAGTFRYHGAGDGVGVPFHGLAGGSIEATSGIVSFNRDGAWGSTSFQIAAGAEVNLNAGTKTWTGTFTGSGGGILRLGGGTQGASEGGFLTPGAGGATLDFPAGFFHFSGNATINPGGVLTNVGEITITNQPDLIGTIDNAGVVRNLGHLDVGVGARFNNLSGATFELARVGGGTVASGAATVPGFFNSGTIRLTEAGTHTISVPWSNLAGTTIDVAAGTLAFHSEGNWEGANIQIATGSVVTLNSGDKVWTGTFAGTGGGVLRLGGGTHGASAGGLITVGTGGATINFPNGGFEFSGNASLAGETLTNLGKLTFADRPDLSLTINNTGTLLNQGQIDFSATGRINNQVGGVFEIAKVGGGGFTSGGSSVPGIFNAGTLLLAINADVDSGVPFSNTGLVNVTAGTLRFPGSVFTQTAGSTQLAGGNLGGGTLNFAGGELTGAGTITGSVNSSGATVRPGGTGAAGTITISGTYTQGTGGMLAVELGGAGAGQFDVLAVGGTATLGGTLNATLLGGFVPASGTTFQILTAAPRAGTFGTTNLPPGFTAQNNATNLTLLAPVATVFTWDGSDSTDWFDADNWTPTGVPGAADTAILDNGALANQPLLGASTSVAVFQQSDGVFSSPVGVTFTVLNNFAWSGGTQAGTGATTVAAGATLNLAGAAGTTLNQRTLNSDGTATWTGAGNFNIVGNATLNVGGLFDIQTGADFAGAGGTIAVQAAGTLRKSGGATNTDVTSINVTNAGQVQAQAGTLQFHNTFTQTAGTTALAGGSLGNGSSGTMNFQGGTLTGTGIIIGDGTVSNTGAVINPGGTNAAGTLAITGNFTQGAGGVLSIELGGATPGTQHDQLAVGGNATLDGTLELAKINGFFPAGGSQFQVLTYGARSGAFASLDGDTNFTQNYQPAALFVVRAALSYVWNGSVSSDWFTPQNWTPNGIPGAGDSATLDTVSTINASAPITVATFTQSAGVFNDSAAFDVTNGFVWNGGVLGGGGAITIPATATFQIGGLGAKALNGRTINNAGTMTWTSGDIDANLDPKLNILPGGVLDIQGDRNVVHFGGGASLAIDNAGTLLKSSGVGSSDFDLATLSNSGLVQANTGTLLLPATSSTGGTFDAAAGASIDFTAVTSLDGAMLTGAGAKSLLANTTLANNITANNLMFASGTFSGAAVLTGNATWTGGTFGSGGSLDLPVGSLLAISGAGNKTLADFTLNNAGQVRWNAGTLAIGTSATFTNQPGAVFDLQGDVALADLGGGGLTLQNSGILRKSSGGGTATLIMAQLINTGLVDVLSGTLVLAGAVSGAGSYNALGAGTQLDFTGETLLNGAALGGSGLKRLLGSTTVSGASAFTNVELAGGTFSGDAAITGGLTNSGGVIQPGGTGAAGTISFSGSYVQTAGGRVAVEIGGTTPGAQFDQLNVGSTATLAGPLDVTFIGGFAPAPGNSFAVLTYANRAGSFAPLNVPAVLTPNYTATTLVFDAVAVSPLIVTTALDVIDAADGLTSLREAILFANGNAGFDTITFNIPGAGVQKIAPTGTALPSITDPVVIDGYSQPGANPNFLADGNDATLLIELSGENLGAVASANGLTIGAGGSTVRGLIINRFFLSGGSAISLSGLGGNTIAGNWLGTTADGLAAPAQRNDFGIAINNSPGNIIGGTEPGDRNVISGNAGRPILINSSSDTQVLGNFIGTNKDGTAALGNGSALSVENSPNALIGGTVPGARNIISGNTTDSGIVFFGGSAGSSVLGNFIGTDVTGTIDLGNAIGVTAHFGNVTIGGANAGNVISGNDEGIVAFGPGMVIRGNFIGTNATGTAALGNSMAGVSIHGSGAIVGGSGAGEGNVISGNTGPGIVLTDGAANGLIAGNFIGTDITGTASIANDIGVLLEKGASNNTIGGTDPTMRNVISGNADSGISILDPLATGNQVLGNFIGTNAAGLAALPNAQHGIFIRDANQNTIGGANGGNVISGNAGSGIRIEGTTTVDQLGERDFNDGQIVASDTAFLAAQNGEPAPFNRTFVMGQTLSFTHNFNTQGLAFLTFSLWNLESAQPGQQVTRFQFDGVDQPLDQFENPGTPVNTVEEYFFFVDQAFLTDGSLTVSLTFGGIAADGEVAQSPIVIPQQVGIDYSRLQIEPYTDNTIAGNFIGTTPDGAAALGNGADGITLDHGVSVTIGGFDPAERNIISGNAGSGVRLQNASNFVRITGNIIGTNAAGDAALPNAEGVTLEFSYASQIGGFGSQGNLISGNLGAGVHLTSFSSSNSVVGNLIGTDVTGAAPLANGGSGVLLDGNASNNFIGDTEEADNTISGNQGDGILIMEGSNDNRIRGNFIGTDSSGTFAVRNDGSGVRIQDASGNWIGGLGAGDGNVISGNDSGGIRIGGDSSANMVQGNRIGTDIDGVAAIPNDRDGIALNAGAQDTNISRNVISGNFGDGILIASGADANQILGNYIGTDALGKIALGNLGHGINIAGNDNFIGYSDFEAGNLISGNAQRGVFITGNDNIVRGSLIGTDSAGITAIGNGFDGLTIAAPGSNNVIGGDTPADRNVISGNDISGISIESLNDADGFASGNIVQGNFIGVAADGLTPLGNRAALGQLGWGVVILRQANDNLIGGTTPGTANLIAFNDGPGVAVAAGAPANNAIIGNSIVSNGGLAIDLGSDGVTANDAGDGDLGPNALLNHPVITSVLRSPADGGGFDYTVAGTYSGAPNRTLTIELYANNGADPSGFGEGEASIARFVITTDGNGAATFSRTFTTAATNDFGSPIGAFVTGTATMLNGLSGPTSEFSDAVAASNPAGDIIIRNGADAEGQKGAGTMTFRVRLTQAVTSPVSVHFATHDLVMPGAATVGEDYEFTEGNVTFAPGETEKFISVLVHGDRTPEARERFGITLSNPVGAGLPESEAVGAILDDDHHLLFAGQSLGSQVEIRNASTGNLVRRFSAFSPDFKGGVRVASGNVNGDGFDDVIVGAGNGGGARVRVFDGHNVDGGRPVKLYDFQAFGSGYRGGVYVAAGDVNGDGHADIIVAPSAGSSAEVRIFNGENGSSLTSFFAFGRGAGGVRVATGDVNGDGYADIIAGTGKGSSVRIFDGQDPSVMLDSFRAFPRVYDRGISVAGGDVNGDGRDDVIVGAAKLSKLVRIFLSGEEGRAAEFAAYGGPARGVHVGAVDTNSDGIADIITSQGRGGDSKVRIYKGNSVLNDAPKAPIKFNAFGPAFSGGVFVG